MPLVFWGIPKQTIKNFEFLKLTVINVHLMQKSVILRSATILRRHLEL